MGMIQKVLWWVFWYAIIWFAIACFIGGIGEYDIPMPIKAILFFALFIFPGWYATRKVKQKALKKEMEQRARTPISTPQPIQQPVSPAPPSVPQSAPTPTQKPVSVPEPQPTTPYVSQTASIPAKNIAATPNEGPSPISNLTPGTLPDFNSATVDELTKLSGVNRILAMKIISVRDKDGVYGSFEDLFARVQLTPQAQDEIRRHFSIVQTSEGRFIDF